MTLTATPIQQADWEELVGFSDDDGFECYIAVHNTKLGPALGGCRIKPYASSDDALLDVLRLSKGMTYKSALAGLNLGGGKCVVKAERATDDVMRKVGEAVNYFTGRYITAEDVGTTLRDVQVVGEVSPYTVHIDGSSNTARGVLACMKKAAKLYAPSIEIDDNLSGIPIWVEGLGKVGYDLVIQLATHIEDCGYELVDGLNLFVSDLDQARVQAALTNFNAREIAQADKRLIAVYAPCAMGQVVNAKNIIETRYSIICGSANNQLTDESYAEVLQQAGVLYCPDFLTNAGGVITAAGEIENWSEDFIGARCDMLGDVLENVITLAADAGITPLAAAKIEAERRFG